MTFKSGAKGLLLLLLLSDQVSNDREVREQQKCVRAPIAPEQPVLGSPLVNASEARHISLPNSSSNKVAIDASLNSVTVDPSATTFSKAA